MRTRRIRSTIAPDLLLLQGASVRLPAADNFRMSHVVLRSISAFETSISSERTSCHELGGCSSLRVKVRSCQVDLLALALQVKTNIALAFGDPGDRRGSYQ